MAVLTQSQEIARQEHSYITVDNKTQGAHKMGYSYSGIVKEGSCKTNALLGTSLAPGSRALVLILPARLLQLIGLISFGPVKTFASSRTSYPHALAHTCRVVYMRTKGKNGSDPLVSNTDSVNTRFLYGFEYFHILDGYG